MVIRKTALGKPIDMAALVTKNDKTRAVGNMKVNARGDTIDSTGRIVQPVTSKVSKSYSNTVGNRTANPARAIADKIKPEPIQVPNIVADELPKEEELTQEEMELIAEMEDDFEVEEIKKASNKEEE